MSKAKTTSTAPDLSNTVLADAVFRPMLFSTPMVKSLLNGSKTQTRRLNGLETANIHKDYLEYKGKYELFEETFWSKKRAKGICHAFKITPTAPQNLTFNRCIETSPISIGNIIWVRESFQYVHNRWFDFVDTVYKADEVAWDLYGCKWKPSLFMPKEACRLFLKVTDVRIERLNDISELDSINEGILRNHGGFEMYSNFEKTPRNYCLSAIESYRSLWEKINGKGSWLQNPFVWVYSFERVECPRGFR